MWLGKIEMLTYFIKKLTKLLENAIIMLKKYGIGVLMVETKSVVLVCTIGMSSSMLISKMQQVIYEQDLPVKVMAISTQEALDYVKEHNTDLVLLSPQVRFMQEKFKTALQDKKSIVEIINMSDYGMLNSQNILQHALELLQIEK